MSEDLLKTIKGLLAEGKGDSKRLHQIIDVVKSGEPVVMSDYRYIQNLLESPSVPQNEQPKPNTTKRDTSLEVLRVRLAEGHITIEEYRVLKQALMEEE